jgi:predicted ATPase
LDGIALAIELAASRVGVYDLAKTLSMLDDRLNLSWVGRRTALARHQTLSATLDWSFGLLAEPERLVLKRLSVFRGGFSLDAAVTVTADDRIDEASVSDCIWELRSKSLIANYSYGDVSRLRLLDTPLPPCYLPKAVNSSSSGDVTPSISTIYSDIWRQWIRPVGPECLEWRSTISGPL